MLSSLPGIGPKTAKRLIIELKDKFTITNDHDIPSGNDLSSNNQDAYNALLTLGYKSIDIKNSIDKILLEQPNLKTEELIKYCLKELT